MAIEMRYRSGRYLVEGPRGRGGARPAPLRLAPASPVPQMDWEDAVRRITRIRVAQTALLATVAALTVAGPVGVASLHWSHALPVIATVGAALGVALSSWTVLDRSMRRLVAALAQSARVLAGLAATDPLTELPNHRAFHERLQREAADAAASSKPLSLVLLDLDRFKQINDTLGHPVGDEVAREAARRLRACAREGEMVARLGGDEFAWIVPGDGMDAWQAAERARVAIGSGRVGGTGLRITVSAGVCELAQAASTVELVRLADGALYWAKAHGRDRCVRYSPDVVEELSADDRAVRLEHQQAMNAVLALARAVDAKDPYTMEHSERVADMAVRLALELDWSPERTRLLREAAVLHDVGKIGVPDAVLSTPAPLSEEELAMVREHPVRGAEIVAEALTREQVAWVRGHHERFDGGGYPDGLAGSAVPDGAAILALADAWDAMTSDRPYRAGLGAGRALEICREESGAQFAPEVVAALLALWESGGVPATGARPEQPLGATRMQYRGVAASAVSLRRERPSMPGTGLVYRGRTVPEDPPAPR